MENNNGFADALERMKTLMQVDEKVTHRSLEEAAQYFASKLKKKINKSNLRKRKHLRDMVKVVVKGDVVSVVFEDDGWYWHMADKGHKKRGGGRVKGLHFVENTWSAENRRISDILLSEIIKKMEG